MPCLSHSRLTLATVGSSSLKRFEVKYSLEVWNFLKKREREVGEGMTSGKENEYFVTKYQQGNYSRYGNWECGS
mgnify:CR=1 FL=1